MELSSDLDPGLLSEGVHVYPFGIEQGPQQAASSLFVLYFDFVGSIGLSLRAEAAADEILDRTHGPYLASFREESKSVGVLFNPLDFVGGDEHAFPDL